MPEENSKQTSKGNEGKAGMFPGTVVRVLDPYTLVINRGTAHGVKEGQNFVIYGISEEELVDPETQKNLGFLEIVRGKGQASHVQENLSTIAATRRYAPTRIIHMTKSSFPFGIPEETETVEPVASELIPFEGARVGDKARPV
jgi:hypothetical protein